jgi:uncharacterized protein
VKSELVVPLLFAVVLSGCGHKPAPSNATPPPGLSPPRVHLPDGAAIEVELAANDETRQQGLMYRDGLAADRGMLFLFPQSGNYPFWMKNTLIPLDMIWIDERLRVTHVERNVMPCRADPCPSYDPGAAARFVLELAAGQAARHGVGNGSVLRFEGIDLTARR